jgi:hypothetical protein
MIRLIKPVSDGGVPYINPDFVNILQNNNIKSYGAFYESINDVKQGNCGIIIRGIKNVTQKLPNVPVTNISIDFSDSLIYLDGDIRKPNGLISSFVQNYNTNTIYLISDISFEETRVNKVFDSNLLVLENRTFNVVTSEPTIKNYIKIEINQFNNNICTRYLQRVLKYYMSNIGDVYSYVGTDLYWFNNTTGLGYGPFHGFALCDGRNGTSNLTNRFLLGFDNSTTSSPTNNNNIENSIIIKNYKKIGNIGGFNFVKLLEKNLPKHFHGFLNPQSPDFSVKEQKYTTGATNDMSHSHEITVNDWPKTPTEGNATRTFGSPFRGDSWLYQTGDFNIPDNQANLGLFGPWVAARMPKPVGQNEVNTLTFQRLLAPKIGETNYLIPPNTTTSEVDGDSPNPPKRKINEKVWRQWYMLDSSWQGQSVATQNNALVIFSLATGTIRTVPRFGLDSTLGNYRGNIAFGQEDFDGNGLYNPDNNNHFYKHPDIPGMKVRIKLFYKMTSDGRTNAVGAAFITTSPWISAGGTDDMMIYVKTNRNPNGTINPAWGNSPSYEQLTVTTETNYFADVIPPMSVRNPPSGLLVNIYQVETNGVYYKWGIEVNFTSGYLELAKDQEIRFMVTRPGVYQSYQRVTGFGKGGQQQTETVYKTPVWQILEPSKVIIEVDPDTIPQSGGTDVNGVPPYRSYIDGRSYDHATTYEAKRLTLNSTFTNVGDRNGQPSQFWEQRPDSFDGTNVVEPSNFAGAIDKDPSPNIEQANGQVSGMNIATFVPRKRVHLWNHKHTAGPEVGVGNGLNVVGGEGHPNLPPHMGVVYYEKIPV